MLLLLFKKEKDGVGMKNKKLKMYLCIAGIAVALGVTFGLTDAYV